MRRNVVVGAVLLVMAAAMGSPAAVGAQTGKGGDAAVEAPRQVTSGGNPLRTFDIPALAVDPRDPSTVVMAVGDSRNGGCGLRVSRDGGLSWTTTAQTLLADPADFCIQRAFGPVMRPVFGSDGVLHVAMPTSSPATDAANGPIGMVVANTSDLGATHETVTVAKGETTQFNPADYGAQGPAQEGNSWHKFTGMGVDPRNPNRLYLMWRWLVWGKDLRQLQGDFVVRPYFSTSDDGGRTWTKPIDVFNVTRGEKAFGSGAFSVVVGPDGAVYGFAKESVKPVPTGETAPSARHLMFKSTDMGKTWDTSALDESVARMGNPEAAIDAKTGKLYLAYEQRGAAVPSTSPPNPQRILFRASSDGGKTWTKPLKITDEPPDKKGDQYYPGISVAPNGRVEVAWHDFRNDPFFFPGKEGDMGTAVGQRYWDVYYAYSNDAGATWSKNLRITNPSIDAKHGATFNNIDTRGPIGIASTDNAAYLAWADSRATVDENEAEDAYMARVRFTGVTQLGASTTTPGSTKLSWAVIGAGLALALGGLVLILGGRRGATVQPEPGAVAGSGS